MPRPLVIGNGCLLVAYDKSLSIRDLTYPYVGLHNHLNGHKIRIGIWAAGNFAWMEDPGWTLDLSYERDTLVTRAVCKHSGLRIRMVVSDCVSHRENILLRRFDITNLDSAPRECRLFLAHDFHIAENDIGDTAFYNPFVEAIVHYKRDNYFLISGTTSHEGIFQYTTGVKGFQGAEGTWRDAEDGWLSMNPIEQGSVDSTISFRVTVPPNETRTVRTWICAGKDMNEAAQLHYQIAHTGFDTMREQTASYWRAWCRNEDQEARLSRLPEPIVNLFRRSLLVIRTQVDNHGAIIAANDSDIMETARANYSYMWPRDGALVSAALDRLGYQDITRRFFYFCRKALPRMRPVLMHKYSADGSWGASWHPWMVGEQNEIPFQQDSTALTIWALWRHFRKHGDLEFIEKLYDEFILPASDFLAQYRDPRTGLPLPSYDLWEERRGVHAYTCGTVSGALRAAHHFALLFNDQERARRYEDAGQELREGIQTYLWDEASGRFARRLTMRPDGSVDRDMTIDSAVYALFAFGALPADDPHLRQTMDRTWDRLTVRTPIGGIARYENDYYFRRSDDIARIPGNPWIICTLWAAQYSIACANTVEELAPALERLEWAVRSAANSGVLPEQLHPETGEPLSVSPLTWSHAEFVATVVHYLNRLDILENRNPESAPL